MNKINHCYQPSDCTSMAGVCPFGCQIPYNKIEDVVTLRTEVMVNNGGPEWYRELIGPTEKIEWLRSRLGQEKTSR